MPKNDLHIKILMVCSGNVCRSPLAAGVLKKKLTKKGIGFKIDSAGFEPYNLGEGTDYLTLEFAKRQGLDITDHKVRLFTKNDFDEFDMIYVMDYTSYRDVMFHAQKTAIKRRLTFFLIH